MEVVGYVLMPGALTIDLVDGSVSGDLDHCPKEDLLESARALNSLLPSVRHKGLWGLGKAYDADCYLYTTDKRYKLPDGPTLPVMEPHHPREKWRSRTRPFSLIALHVTREEHWRGHSYSKLIGSVLEDQVSEDTTGVSSHYDAERWERPVGETTVKQTGRVAKPAPRRRGPKAARQGTSEVQGRFF
jgi:hypothetical protein